MAELYDFQKDAVAQLCSGKHIIRADCGVGKSAIMIDWLVKQHPTHVIIATTASKVASGGFDEDIEKFAEHGWKSSLKTLDCVSWNMLYKWVKDKTPEELSNYIFCADECQRCKGGVSSKMGKAFLLITKHCKAWAGFTATPGDVWMDYCAYFIADGKVRNKTAFQREFCIMQHYPFPMVLKYQNVATLKKWWGDMSYIPDTSIITKQLPRFTNQIIKVPAPKGYKKVLKTSTTLDGEFLDSCLPADTLVDTDQGVKEIADIKVGEKVRSYNHDKGKYEYKPVTKLIKNPAEDSVLVLYLSNGSAIISTNTHRHFTGDKYTMAQDIKIGDYLYEYPEAMYKLRKACPDSKYLIPSKKNAERFGQDILFYGLQSRICGKKEPREIDGQACRNVWGESFLRLLQPRDVNKRAKHKSNEILQGKSQGVLQQGVQLQKQEREGSCKRVTKAGKRTREDSSMLLVWQTSVSGNIKRDKITQAENDRQSILLQRTQPGVHKTTSKRMALPAQRTDETDVRGCCTSASHSPSGEISRCIGQRMADGIPNKIRGAMGKRLQRLLQCRHSEPSIKDSDRSRWPESQWSETKGTRQKENRQISPVRVEGVEILELSDIKRLGLYREPDYVYCLDVEDNHNFFANGVLTHNCMALLHELRQMCATPDKLSALSDLLESLSSPLVLFYNYTCEREQILGLAQKLGRKVWRIDGECHEIPTDKTIGEKDIVLCHYLSGSEALNLQFCNYWLSYSHNYSYSTTKQAMGRIRRVGQDKPQFYYWLWAEGTVEDDIAKALHDKGDFVKELWSPERS